LTPRGGCDNQDAAERIVRHIPIMNAITPEAINVLNSDAEIRGNLKCGGSLIFDGRLDGDLTVEGSLELGENTTIKGNLTASNVVARGRINGNITARDRLEVKARTELVGDVRAAKLMIEEGVTFLGKAEISPTKTATPGAAHMPKPADAYKATEIGKPASR
jgi:cytoskeletal protein CcmA (bactofilin family)